MKQERVRRIHLIYGCIAAVLIIALGIALILSCLDIYNSGARPYTPESIATHFQNISLLAYACIAVAIGGIVLELILPANRSKPKAVKDEMAFMEKAKSKASNLDTDVAASAKKEQTLRLVLRICTAAIFTGFMVYPTIYFMDGSHFSVEALNDDVRKAVCIALSPALLGLLLCYICATLERKSIIRETELYSKSIGNTANAKVAKTKAPVRINFIRGFLLALAVCFIVLGVFNGGMKDVFDKAVAICTECIGLG